GTGPSHDRRHFGPRGRAARASAWRHGRPVRPVRRQPVPGARGGGRGAPARRGRRGRRQAAGILQERPEGMAGHVLGAEKGRGRLEIDLDTLRRFAVARSLHAPTTLSRALERAGFVQADPIRAPARAQDLTLRHRVRDYRAGDLERRYAMLDIEEDFFLIYGF